MDARVVLGVAILVAAALPPSSQDTLAAKRRYVAAAEAACLAAGRQTDPGRYPVSTEQEDVEELERAARVMRATVERIAAIRPPQADAAMLRARFVEPGRRLAGRLGGHATRARAALAAGDAGTVRRLVEASLRPDPTEVSMRSFALSYGFAICAGEQP
ncbi:hypothetical protein ACIBHY_24970 [Nonomuraea sp. NPDC050547]|uniref:hypothetical protein n=1 Tax=Nonomuraea sp. NPDC050547 TaxID=3364368 RepID=UPI00379C0BEF